MKQELCIGGITDKGTIVWYDYIDDYYVTHDHKFYFSHELTIIKNETRTK
jgi:hypothetical protein